MCTLAVAFWHNIFPLQPLLLDELPMPSLHHIAKQNIVCSWEYVAFLHLSPHPKGSQTERCQSKHTCSFIHTVAFYLHAPFFSNNKFHFWMRKVKGKKLSCQKWQKYYRKDLLLLITVCLLEREKIETMRVLCNRQHVSITIHML